MSQITVVRCRLTAEEATLRHLWTLMAEHNTPLITEILQRLNAHPDFNTWLTNTSQLYSEVDIQAKQLKNEPLYQGMPQRFIISAITLVKDIYKSWFAIKRGKLFSLKGKKRFLSILKSDAELLEETQCDFDTLRNKAQQILQETKSKLELEDKEKDLTPKNNNEVDWNLINTLYDAYEKTKSPLKKSVIAFIIKNNGFIPEEPEPLEYYQKRRKKKEIQIIQLEKELQGSAPFGRILDSSQWLDVLNRSQEPITTLEEFTTFQNQLLQKSSELPFPVFYGTNTDLNWFTNQQGRICVKFNGLSKYSFEIACNRRQFHWFQRFLADYECYKQQHGKAPAGLMVLRSAHLVWKESQEKGEPWNSNCLYLHCAFDYRLSTVEGTEIVKAEKIVQTKKQIENFQAKEELSPNQQQRLRANQTSLNLLEAPNPFKPFRSKTYQGKPSLIAAVSIGLETPATLAIVDIESDRVLAYRNTKQLLGKTRKLRNKKQTVEQSNNNTNPVYKYSSNYDLFLLYQQKKHKNKHKNHLAQLKNASNYCRDSELGLYINRLLARAIIEVAQEYEACTIVLPDLKNLRVIIESEIRARAELKYPGSKERQDNYAIEYRASVHQWSYKQLSDCITSVALKRGITVEIRKQTSKGNHQQKAKSLALSLLSTTKN